MLAGRKLAWPVLHRGQQQHPSTSQVKVAIDEGLTSANMCPDTAECVSCTMPLQALLARSGIASCMVRVRRDLWLCCRWPKPSSAGACRTSSLHASRQGPSCLQLPVTLPAHVTRTVPACPHQATSGFQTYCMYVCLVVDGPTPQMLVHRNQANEDSWCQQSPAQSRTPAAGWQADRHHPLQACCRQC